MRIDKDELIDNSLAIKKLFKNLEDRAIDSIDFSDLLSCVKEWFVEHDDEIDQADVIMVTLKKLVSSLQIGIKDSLDIGALLTKVLMGINGDNIIVELSQSLGDLFSFVASNLDKIKISETQAKEHKQLIVLK